MKWTQISAIPDSDGNHCMLWALNESGELWFYNIRQDAWFKQRGPNAKELARPEVPHE